jgi:hypothetical protein
LARQDFSVTLNGNIDKMFACKETSHRYGGYPKTVISNTSTETTVGVSRRKPKGFIYPTAYTFEKIKIDFQQGTCDHYPAGGASKHVVGQYFTGVVGCPGTSGRFDGNTHFDGAINVIDAKMDLGLRNTALIAVRNKLKSTSINLGVAFGERNQTARLLGDTASRIARSIRALRRGQIRRSMDELGISSRRRQPRGSNVPQRWLELQYGWKPLLSDVYGAAEALEKRPKGDWRVTAKATRKRSDTYLFERIPASGTNFDGCSCRASVMRSVFARLDALPQNEATISLASLGVTNPLSVAWELVPWSFVVDWALPIGSFLESLDAMLGYGDATYSSSLLVKATWKDKGLSASFSNGYIKNSFAGRKKLVYLSRQVSASVPLPTLPGFKDPRSLGHMANGLALMATAFGRR